MTSGSEGGAGAFRARPIRRCLARALAEAAGPPPLGCAGAILSGAAAAGSAGRGRAPSHPPLDEGAAADLLHPPPAGHPSSSAAAAAAATLADIFAGGSLPSLPEPAVAAVVARVAAGLGALHAAGIVHRGVSTAAVFAQVVRGGGGHHPAALHLRPETVRLAPGATATRLPAVGGSAPEAAEGGLERELEHPAPEIARARARAARHTPAADMWALGAMAAGLLGGGGSGGSGAPTFTLPAALLAAAAGPGRGSVDALQAWVDASLAALLAGAGASPAAHAVLAALLRVDPAQRPAAGTVAACAWAASGLAGCGVVALPSQHPWPVVSGPAVGEEAPPIVAAASPPTASDGGGRAAAEMGRLWLTEEACGSHPPPPAEHHHHHPPPLPPPDAATPPVFMSWLARLLPRRSGSGEMPALPPGAGQDW